MRGCWSLRRGLVRESCQLIVSRLAPFPNWDGQVYPPVFFQRVSKVFVYRELRISSFWECARRWNCWGYGDA